MKRRLQPSRLCLRLVLLPVFAAVTAFSYCRLAAVQVPLERSISEQQEALYLPNLEAARFISFGYENLLADLLWFNTISYFGKHYRGDRSYGHLEHMCGLVTDLDPGASHVYEFCSLMLIWEAKQVDRGMAMLTKAVRQQPDNWRNYYLRGMNYALFLGNEEAAQADFEMGAAKVQSEAQKIMMTRLAAKKLAGLSEPGRALEFLREAAGNAGDPSQRRVLEEQYRKALHEVRLEELQAAVDRHVQQAGSLPENLGELGLGAQDLADPFGGTYFLDGAAGKVASTSKVERFLLFKAGRK